MWLLLWIGLFVLLFLVPISVFAPRWGAPWPYAYRQRRFRQYDHVDVLDAQSAAPREPIRADPWWFWADLLWFVFLAMVVWAAVALIF